jgi:DNA-binding transcriptional MocR family regulator
VVLTHMGLMDPRAYVRLAAILRQQIADGTLQPGGRTPRSPVSAKITDMHRSPVARRCGCWKAKGC